MAGAYKATPIEVLQAETLIPPIKEYLDQLQANARFRLKTSGQAAFIRKQCNKIEMKLRNRNRKVEQPPNTPEIRKAKWALSINEGVAHNLASARVPRWVEEDENYLQQLGDHQAVRRQREKQIKKHFADRWQFSWGAYQKKHDRNPTAAQTAGLAKKERLDLHTDLAKAESALAVQVRTEKIGFAKFLHQQHVPSAISLACDCGWNSQTAKHIIRHCSLRPHRRRMLEEAGTATLVTTPNGLKIVTAW